MTEVNSELLKAGEDSKHGVVYLCCAGCVGRREFGVFCIGTKTSEVARRSRRELRELAEAIGE